jgi:hypothetical protein
MIKMLNEGSQIYNFISSSGSGTGINYGSGSDFLTSYGSGSTSQKVTVPTVPVPHAFHGFSKFLCSTGFYSDSCPKNYWDTKFSGSISGVHTTQVVKSELGNTKQGSSK